ncbi:MAG TPA: hypothetical protein VGQ83_11245, partial [Polyangia bacterium]
APYVCSGQSALCPNSCALDADCVAGDYCVLGSCTNLLPNGRSCTAAAQCASGNCVDGLCCDTPCAGACVSCVLPATKGACTRVPAGDDPHGLCPGGSDPACRAVCGDDGLCGFPGDARACGSWTCTGTALRRFSCDGLGDCVDRGALDCAPYQCATLGCPTSCASSAECVPPNTCQGGTCGQHRPPGTACGAASDCESGFCTDGVCCTTACAGACRRCDRPPAAGAALDGVCRVPIGADPDGDCPGAGLCAGSCAADGACAWPGSEQACDTCLACDRAGRCDQAPASGDDPACGVVSCAALATECRTYADLADARCVAPGLCARAADPASCRDASDAPDGTPCAGGVCRGGLCGAPIDAGPARGDPSSSCGCRAGAGPGPGLALLALLALLARRRSEGN